MREEPYDKMSVLFLAISVTGAVASLAGMICLSARYYNLGMADIAKIHLCIGMATAGIWLFTGRKYWKQRESFGVIVITVCMITVFFSIINEWSKLDYYIRLKKLYREYWGEYKGERVDITPNQALLKDWEKHISVFPVWDQGGTIYDYDRSNEHSSCFYLRFRSVYDAEWEGTRAMERYCRTLEHNGWEETRKLLYKREVDGEVYVVDLSEWDKEGKQQVCITYGPEELGPSW